MNEDLQRAEVDRNYDVFQRRLGEWLPGHFGEFALMRHGELVAFFDKPVEAFRTGNSTYGDGIFSIQEVTDEPIDLGFFSHAAH